MAGQDACLQYLAACAALQQWEQSALAYLLLHSSPGPLSADSLSAVVESLLEGNFSVRACSAWLFEYFFGPSAHPTSQAVKLSLEPTHMVLIDRVHRRPLHHSLKPCCAAL